MRAEIIIYDIIMKVGTLQLGLGRYLMSYVHKRRSEGQEPQLVTE